MSIEDVTLSGGVRHFVHGSGRDPAVVTFDPATLTAGDTKFSVTVDLTNLDVPGIYDLVITTPELSDMLGAFPFETPYRNR